MEALQHIPVPIHEKLKHLSSEEIEDIAERYFSGKSRPKDLCKEYNIDSTAYGHFKRLLPPRENIDNSCSVHNAISHQSYIYDNPGWGIPYCPICQKELYTILPYSYFDKEVLEEDLFCMESKHLKTLTNILTLEQYKDFPLSLKAFIIVWFLENPNFETYTIQAHWLDNIKICPTESMKTQFLKGLQEYGLLKNNQYLLQEIEFDNDLSVLFKQREFLLDGSAIEYFSLWRDIAYHEVLEYYIYQMQESNFKVLLGPKSIDTLKYLVHHMSAQNAFYVMWRAVRAGEHILAKSNGDYLLASSVVPGAIKKKADQLLDGTMKSLEFKRTSFQTIKN